MKRPSLGGEPPLLRWALGELHHSTATRGPRMQGPFSASSRHNRAVPGLLPVHTERQICMYAVSLWGRLNSGSSPVCIPEGHPTRQSGCERPIQLLADFRLRSQGRLGPPPEMPPASVAGSLRRAVAPSLTRCPSTPLPASPEASKEAAKTPRILPVTLCHYWFCEEGEDVR